jgi:hypothetical protein
MAFANTACADSLGLDVDDKNDNPGSPTTSMELTLSIASESTEPSPRSPVLLDLSSPNGQPMRV